MGQVGGGRGLVKGRIRSLDGLRAIAFLLVFAYHTWEFAGSPGIPVVTDVVRQNTRVDLFVVISGFVLMLPFALNHDRVPRFTFSGYFRRRLRRIVPPYYVALLLPILLPWVLKTEANAVGVHTNALDALPTWGDIVTHLSFIHLFFPQYWDSINGSLWTMSLEMQFYLLFPLLLLAWYRFGYRSLGVAVGVSLAYRIAVGVSFAGPDFPDLFLWTVTGVGRSMQFVAGMVAADLAIRMRGRLTWPWILGLAAVAVGSYLAATNVPAPIDRILPIRDSGLAVAFGLVAFIAVASPRFERALSVRPLSGLGFMAYSMFLVHQPIIWYVNQFFERVLNLSSGVLDWSLEWLVGLPIVLAFGWMLFRWVEVPATAWAQRIPQTAPAVARSAGG